MQLVVREVMKDNGVEMRLTVWCCVDGGELQILAALKNIVLEDGASVFLEIDSDVQLWT